MTDKTIMWKWQLDKWGPTYIGLQVQALIKQNSTLLDCVKWYAEIDRSVGIVEFAEISQPAKACLEKIGETGIETPYKLTPEINTPSEERRTGERRAAGYSPNNYARREGERRGK
jgi:hypothetical protein